MKALLNRQLSYLAKYQYQQMMKDLEDRIKEMYAKLVQKEEILQKIEKTTGIPSAQGILYMKKDVFFLTYFRLFQPKNKKLFFITR